MKTAGLELQDFSVRSKEQTNVLNMKGKLAHRQCRYYSWMAKERDAREKCAENVRERSE